MQAQEFSSPAEHMASISDTPVSSGSAYRNPNKPFAYDNVDYGPPIDFTSLNNSFEDYRESKGERGSSARSFAKYSNDFNKEYMAYNDRLFHSAKDYDMYMSNTAIQRQVDDLIKAGLNPVLAAHLGGATYKGVNAPYLSISPASALQSYMNYDSSIYATDSNNMTQKEIAQLQSATSQAVAQYNKTMDRLIAGDQYGFQRSLMQLQEDLNESFQAIKHLDDKDLEHTIHINKKDLASYQNVLNKEFDRAQKMNQARFEQDMNKIKYGGYADTGSVLGDIITTAGNLIQLWSPFVSN